jgi:hypothetical protein
MTRVLRWTRRLGLVLAGGYLLTAGGCLADQFWSGLLGNTITGATVSVASALALKLFPGA